MSNILDKLIHPTMIKYDENRLDELKKYAHELGVQHWDIPVITVTGTNGKGSTVASLNAIYQAQGYRVGVFTSPHLLVVNERIQVNQKNIIDSELDELAKILQTKIDLPSLSWFEAFFLIALMYFKNQNLDVLVIEVGMGGRLDATNILDANLVIVSNVDLDHQDYLGGSREEIAFEKAGLFRPHRQAIFADLDCPQSMIKHAQYLKTDFKQLSKDFDYQENSNTWSLSFEESVYHFKQMPTVHLSAISAAIYASYLLNELLPISQDSWQKANENVFLPGRFQQISIAQNAKIILDVGHNPHAARLLAQRLQQLNISGKIHCVYSSLNTKDKKQIVKILSKSGVLWYPSVLNCENACNIEELQACFQDNHLEVGIFNSPEVAFNHAREIAQPEDVILVFGSFHIIEPIMNILIEEGCDVFRTHRSS